MGGRRVAFGYSLSYANKLYLLKPGYDPEYAAYSPANLMCYLTLREAFERGVTAYDFLGVADDWKLQWTKETRSHYRLLVCPDTVKTRAIHRLRFEVLPKVRQDWRYRLLRRGVARVRRSLESAGALLSRVSPGHRRSGDGAAMNASRPIKGTSLPAPGAEP